MKNTHLKLNENSAKKLLEVLEAAPKTARDATWRNLKEDVSRVLEIWHNINIRSLHIARIHHKAKDNSRPSYVKK